MRGTEPCGYAAGTDAITPNAFGVSEYPFVVLFDTNRSKKARACDLPPHPSSGNHCTAMTCAQIASIPMNNASDVSAAASSTTARTMTHPPRLDRTGTMFYFCSKVKGGSGSLQALLVNYEGLFSSGLPESECRNYSK